MKTTIIYLFGNIIWILYFIQSADLQIAMEYFKSIKNLL